jgi:hypothetical protein
VNGGGSDVDPLRELWARMRRVLAPFGVTVGPEVLALWRDSARHGHGPLIAAERGEVREVEELVALLRLLTGTQDPAGDGERSR